MAMDDDTLEWRTIPGYPHYEASSDGYIRSLPRATTRGGLLRQQPDKEGRPRVFLCENGKQKSHLVHHVVLKAFGYAKPNGLQTRHLDGDPANNRLSNIRWGTQKENEADKLRHGRHHQLVKTHCPRGHAYNEENTYINPCGYRFCRTCKRLRSATDKQKAKAKRQ